MITVVGSSNTDFVLKADRLPGRGETILADSFKVVPGGKGANQAVAIRRLGGSVAFVARIGDDAFGRNAIANFKRLGVNTKYITIDKAAPSGLAFIVVDKDGANAVVVAPNSNARLLAEDAECAKTIIEKSHFLLIQLEIPKDAARYAIKLAHRCRAKIVLNPAPIRYRLGGDILSKVFVIIPNEPETEMLTGVRVDSIDAARRAANKLLELGPRYAIITLGRRGALLAGRGENFHIKPINVKAVDTTAAGDAFCGALVFALDEGKSIKQAAEFANAAAALSVTKLGAQPSLPTRKEVEGFLGRRR